MTQEEKNILLKDLCARLLYGVKINHIIYNWEGTCVNFNRKLESFTIEKDNGLCYDVPVEEVCPYLRPMSSMTEEEYKELKEISPDYGFSPFERIDEWSPNYEIIDWLNAHHFDYRGLIFMELALEAPKGMYKIE